MIYCSGFALRYFLAVSALLLSSSNPFAPTNENEKMSKDIFFVFMPMAVVLWLWCEVAGCTRFKETEEDAMFTKTLSIMFSIYPSL